MKYTETRVNKICEALRNSGDMSRCEAVKSAGLSYNCFMEWQRTYPEFKQRIDAVDNEVYLKNHSIALKCVTSKMKDNPKVAQWFLERTDPEHYGRSEKIDGDLNITGVDINYIKPDKKE